jgi:hypothetical protein
VFQREDAGSANRAVRVRVPVGPLPLKANVLGVCRSARDFAKVADQVRFLAGILTDGGYGVVAARGPVTAAVPDRNRLSTLSDMASAARQAEHPSCKGARVGSSPTAGSPFSRALGGGRGSEPRPSWLDTSTGCSVNAGDARRDGHRPRNADEVGSSPTAGSGMILWSRGEAAACKAARRGFDPHQDLCRLIPCLVAQTVERSAVNGTVAGSSPAWAAGSDRGVLLGE